jgi:putative spermidine/putrescine transport system permease protein
MKGLAPHPVTRWVIGILVGLFFAIPMVATLLYTLRDGDGYSLVH